jgi:SAM-dependent methyltransferase
MRDRAAVAPRPYDLLADVYDRWLSGDAAAVPCLAFYLDELRDRATPVLELGVGTGRISLALANSGMDVVGLDASMKMLRRLQASRAAGQPSRGAVKTICGSFERLPFAAGTFAAVILPMRTIGHLVDDPGRRAMFSEVARVLQPGGCFVFDHYNLDRRWAEAYDGRPRLMYAGPGDAGKDTALLIWDRYDYDFRARMLHCTVRIEELRPGAEVRSASNVEFDFRWFEVNEIHDQAAEAGFSIEHCWGSFDRTPFSGDAEHMIFVLRKN